MDPDPLGLSCTCWLLGLLRYDLDRFGEGRGVHQRQQLAHHAMVVPPESLSQAPLADPLLAADEIAKPLVQREARLVQQVLVEGRAPVAEGHVVLPEHRVQLPVQAVLDVPVRPYAVGRVADVLQAGKIVAHLVRLPACDVVDHRLGHAYHGESLLPLREQPFLLACRQGIQIEGPLLQLVVADLAGLVEAAIHLAELLEVLRRECRLGEFGGLALVALQATHVVALGAHDRPDGLRLHVHGVEGDHGVLQIHLFQDLLGMGDLVRLRFDRLAEQAGLRILLVDVQDLQVPGLLGGAGIAARAPQLLAVHRHDPVFRDRKAQGLPDRRVGVGQHLHQQRVELVRLDEPEDPPERVVAGDLLPSEQPPVELRMVPPEILGAQAALGSRERREEHHQDELAQLVGDPPLHPAVRHVPEQHQYLLEHRHLPVRVRPVDPDAHRALQIPNLRAECREFHALPPLAQTRPHA